MKKLLTLLSIVLLLFSCGDDGDDGIQRVPPRLLSEVAPENNAQILEYLQTHFYNFDEFENPPADFDFRIVIDTIAGDNAGRKPLIEDIRSQVFMVSPNDFNLDQGDEEVPHTLYYLIAREGVGARATFADSTFVRIEGTNLEGGVFQPFNVQPIWFDLPGSQLGGGTVRGFREGVATLMGGGDIIENSDGTFEVENYGIGLVILPSGLGFFNNSNTNLPAFTPGMFTIDLFTSVVNTDHDNDGIPSFQEDLNNDRNLINDNTDIDTENLGFSPNYLDADDDNDGILTRDEIDLDEDGNLFLDQDGNPIFRDTNGDGTPDYLDPDTN